MVNSNPTVNATHIFSFDPAAPTSVIQQPLSSVPRLIPLTGAAEPTTSPAEQELSDMGNAKRFARQHGENVRYIHVWKKWVVWDGKRWSVDNSGEVMRLAKQTALSIYTEAQGAAMSEQSKISKWALQSQSRERLIAMLALSQSEHPIPASVDSFDTEHWLLNCDNGTVDLRTGKLKPHDKGDLLMKLSPVEYSTEAGDDPVIWLEFLDKIFESNAELIGYIRRFLGCTLVGEIFENLLVIFHGCGSNGKSVMQETWLGVLGKDYAMAAPDGFLMQSKNDKHSTELTDLFGKRYVCVNETTNNGQLSESRVKQLTSREPIRARRMREDLWEFQPTHHIVLSTNHRPIIKGNDNGIWRRLRLVPFNVTIPDSEQDKELATKLRAEYPAILRWVVGGCIEWLRNGMDLKAPDVVLAATQTYREDQDTIGAFIDECCDTDEKDHVLCSELFLVFQKWSENRGEYAGTKTKFDERMDQRGYKKTKWKERGSHRDKQVFVGVKSKADLSCTWS